MKQLLIFISILSLLGCQNKKQEALAVNFQVDSTAILEEGVIINMEGNKYTLLQNELYPFSVKIESDSLNYSLATKKSDVSLNLNLINTGIVKKKSHTFSIPEDHKKSFLVGLSFFNKNKNVSRLNKRIVFRKGEIDIKEVTKNTLIMTFEGEGSGMRDIKNTFPISGSINIKY